MISGNTELFNKPLRTIEGRVEVIDASTQTQTGNGAVRLEGCKTGVALDVQLSSRNLVDTSKAHNNSSGATILEKGDGYVIAQGKAGSTPGSAAWSSGQINFSLSKTTEIGKNYYISFDIEYLEQMAEFSFPQQIIINFGQGLSCGYLNGLGKYHIEKLYPGKAEVSTLVIYCQSCKVNITNIFVGEESGYTYTPYIGENDYADVELFQYGKNLIDFSGRPVKRNYGVQYLKNNVVTTDIDYLYIDEYIPIAHLQGLKLTTNYAVSTYNANSQLGFAFYDTNKTHIDGTKDTTFTVPNNAVYGRFTFSPNCPGVEAIQFELGNAVTEYELPTEAQVFTPQPDGTVKGLTALSTNSIIAYPPGAVLTVKYAVDKVTETYTSSDRIKAITFDRTGENKFFGFGVSQKAAVKIIDKEYLCGLQKDDKLSICFNDIKITPNLLIEEVSRDEKTAEITVEAVDLLARAANYTINELELNSYSIGELAASIASFLGLLVSLPDLEEFNLRFDEGANFDGAETLREALNAIAEATQTIYYINKDNELVFKRLPSENSWTIDKSQYFELTSKEAKKLVGISSITELGDNVEYTNGESGVIQYVRNNPFWELREDIDSLVQSAVNQVGGLTIDQFDCSWRGNYLLEPGDKITFITKDNSEKVSYLINDKIEYTGGYKQTSNWEYTSEEKEHTNPSTLGEVLKQTYAKVDKANKNIEIVASEAKANTAEIASLHINTESISASVSSIEEKVDKGIGGVNGEIETLKTKVNATMSSEEIKIEIASELANGVETVRTSKGFSFNDDGLSVSSSENNLSTVITEDGMTVKKGDGDVLIANNEGVKAIDLHATTYLIIGTNSRFEDFERDGEPRTACFWIGG